MYSRAHQPLKPLSQLLSPFQRCDPMSMKSLKVKATSLFQGEDRKVLDSVIKTVHLISQRASFLIKYHYLKCLKEFPNDVIAIDKTFIENAFNVVRGRVKTSRTRPDGKIVLFKIYPHKTKNCIATFLTVTSEYKTSNPLIGEEALKDSHDELFQDTVDSPYSISHILGYAIQSLETHYLTNLQCHYAKYIKKFASRSLYSKELKNDQEIKQLTKFLLFREGNCPTAFQGWVNEHFSYLANYQNVFERIYQSPWLAFRDMVCLTQKMEPLKKRLLSPFILRKSDIPGHITLDTSGMAQLFYNSQRIEDFKTDYYFATKRLLPKLKDKATLLRSYKALLGDPKEPPSELETALFATHLWKFIADFRGKRYQEALEHVDNRGVKWVFNNTLMTDGVSVTFTMVPKSQFKRCNAFTKRKGAKEPEPKEPFEKWDSKLPMEKPGVKTLAADPGKNNLLAVTDGLTTFRYTRRQRDHDCQFQRLAKVRRALLPTNVLKYQSEVLGGSDDKGSRSCDAATFQKYVSLKIQGQLESIKEYVKPVFRSLKFKAYCLMKRSEDIMMKRLEETFQPACSKEPPSWMKRCEGEGRCCHHIPWGFQDRRSEDQTVMETIQENVKKKDCELRIFYGNWGRSPNLKHCAPTPGIGLKRKIARRFETYDTPEHHTSKTCPCCLQTSVRQASESTNQLLRCENVECQSRWWSRDVLGAFNILYKTLRSIVTSGSKGVESQRGHLLS